jgi:hypothetical protein
MQSPRIYSVECVKIILVEMCERARHGLSTTSASRPSNAGMQQSAVWPSVRSVDLASLRPRPIFPARPTSARTLPFVGIGPINRHQVRTQRRHDPETRQLMGGFSTRPDSGQENCAAATRYGLPTEVSRFRSGLFSIGSEATARQISRAFSGRKT